MNHLMPIFLKLEHQSCLVVGGGEIAFQKIKQLLDAKAKITIISPIVVEKIRKLSIHIENRNYRSSDILGNKLVFAATDDEKVNRKIYLDANKYGIPINVVDQPDLCSFYMGSVYQDGDLKIAISTNGKCPSLGTYL